MDTRTAEPLTPYPLASCTDADEFLQHLACRILGAGACHLLELVDHAAPILRAQLAGIGIERPRELLDYFAREADRRAGTPGDDAVRLLMTMRGGELTREEVAVNCYSLLLGANVTTPHAIAGTVLALMERPEAYRRAAAAPAAIPGLVEEGLRWTSPASSFLRHTVRDVELGGGVVPAGDPVAAWVGSANRDRTVFTDPYRFDMTRAPNRHLAFGFGPHYCLGAALARLTVRVFFEECLGMIEEFSPAGEPGHLASSFVAGYTRVPVRARLRRSLRARDMRSVD